MTKTRWLYTHIIFFLVIGLIGVNFGQTAQARTHNELGTSPVTVKKAAAPEKSAEKKQSTHSTKKSRTAKKKIKAKHASASSRIHHTKTKHARNTQKPAIIESTLTSSVPTDIETMPNEERSSLQPTDLWLAKDAWLKQRTAEEQPNELTLKILDSAYSYLGTPYRYGGSTPEAFDCSGFVRHVFGENGIALSRSSREQAREGMPISLSDLKPGDLIFFDMHRRNRYRINHVGLYIGGGHFIHAASLRSRHIKIEKLESNFFQSRIVKARRIIDSLRSP
jgi:cell wall-associated NlpC family hydrolase